MKPYGMRVGTLLLSGLLLATTASAQEEAEPDLGRYQLFMGEYTTGLRTGETPERSLFRIDTVTGTVWIGKQIQYLDKKSGKQVFQRYWEPFEQYVTELTPPAPPKP